MKAELNKSYGLHVNAYDGVSFHVFSSNSECEEDPERLDHNEAALLDMWLLSYSQSLLTSPHSTFGYIPKALGGAETWVLNDLDGCIKSRTSDPCYQIPPSDIRCPPLLDGEEAWEDVKHRESLVGTMSKCEDFDHMGNLALMNYDPPTLVS